MLKRNSNFTLIELIVVIVVLGILAAIVVPNISSFSKQAREAQYTADLRNIQTGFDMESAKSDDLETGLVHVTAAQFETAHVLNQETGAIEAAPTVPAVMSEDGLTEIKPAGPETTAFKLIDTKSLVPEQLRKLPKYVVSTDGIDDVAAFAQIDNKKIYVAVGVQVDEAGKSKAVLNYIGAVSEGEETADLAKDTRYIVR